MRGRGIPGAQYRSSSSSSAKVGLRRVRAQSVGAPVGRATALPGCARLAVAGAEFRRPPAILRRRPSTQADGITLWEEAVLRLEAAGCVRRATQLKRVGRSRGDYIAHPGFIAAAALRR